MTLVAHLSDLHLLEENCHRRQGLARYRLSYLNVGVAYDPQGRRRRVAQALLQARRAHAQHLLITGDLTEDGSPAQYDLLREVLAESGFVPEQVTLAPGNHDVYADEAAWEKALRGPLAAYRATSVPGAVSVLDGVVLKPISTMVERQSFTISTGRVRRQDVEAADALARDPVCRGRTLLLAMHHPPLGLPNPIANAVDGLMGIRPLRCLLESRAELRVVHGHVHRRVDRRMRGRAHVQIVSTGAVRDGGEHLRLYEVDAGGLRDLQADLEREAPCRSPKPARNFAH